MRVDNELRAEAADYHVRQPYAVMVGILFLPIDACDDASLPKTASSFGDSVKFFRNRSARAAVDMAPDLFERFFIGLYDLDAKRFGNVSFFDVMDAPPKSGRPSKMLSLDQIIKAIVDTYDNRNSPPFKWAEGDVVEPSPPSDEFEGDDH